MEKRELFVWKEKHEKLLISEVLQEEPYKYKQGSKERGSCWTNIADRMAQAGLKVTQRSVREKFNKMMNEFKKKEQEELKASGIEVEYGEVDQGLCDISERITEIEEEREKETKKMKKVQESAEEMRKKAAETLSQTKKRKSSGLKDEGDDHECDSDPDEDEDATPNKKKRRQNASVTEIMKESMEAKKQEKAKELEMRDRELEARLAEQESQRSFQERMVQQQSAFMQQQQAMTMAMINAINEMVKKLNN